MKKVKELLLFIALLVIPLVLFIVVTGFTADLISDRPSFVGVENYIRMFLHDKTFVKALFNSFATPVICVSVFALCIYLLRKKIKSPRLLFYIGGVFVGGIASLAHVVYISIALFGVPTHLYTTQVLVSHITDYRPYLFDVLSVWHILSSVYIGIFTAFIFWILELIVDIVKKFIRKRDMYE